ncbi:MAG: hypothetical protein WC334_03790 [Kiritimatiellales bacterium]|jgi:hypothetical protein
MKKALIAGFSAVLLFIAAMAADHFFFAGHYVYQIRASHFWRSELWSIGIVRGEKLFKLITPEKPILRARDITDTAARMVADPFAVQENGQWYLFFEMGSITTHQGRSHWQPARTPPTGYTGRSCWMSRFTSRIRLCSSGRIHIT